MVQGLGRLSFILLFHWNSFISFKHCYNQLIKMCFVNFKGNVDDLNGAFISEIFFLRHLKMFFDWLQKKIFCSKYYSLIFKNRGL